MNNPWVAQTITRIAERLELVDRSDVDRRIQMLYELVYGREATAEELELGREFLASQADVLETSAESMGAWQTYIQALVLANEFLYEVNTNRSSTLSWTLMSASVTKSGEGVEAPRISKPKPRRVQFGLRSLLTTVAIIAAVLAFWRVYVLRYQAEFALIDRIKSFNAVGALGNGDFQVFTEPRGQFFLRQLFGDKLSQRAVYVHLISDQVTDEWLHDNLAGLRHVEVLTITSPTVTDAGLQHLRTLTNLNVLGLPNAQVTDEGIEELRRALPNLRRVWR
jgi:hypothetical protein